MSTSPHEGLIRTGLTVDSGSAIGASIARDYLLNNLLHLADEYAQVRMAMGNTTYLEALETNVFPDRYYLMASSGAFPLPMRANRVPYALRIRIGGACSDAGTVSFRVVLAPPGLAAGYANPEDAAGDPIAPSWDFVWEATATGSTASWLTGATTGPNASANLLTVDAETAAGWMVNTATLTDLAGDTTTAQQCLVAVHVFASTADLARSARLHAAYAAEWIGDA